MTRRLVESMNGKLKDGGHVSTGFLIDVKQGSNFQGPLITIFELTEVRRGLGQPIDKTKFIAFILSQMMKEGMQAGDIHNLADEQNKFFRELGESIRLRCPKFLSQLGINDETEVDCTSFSSKIFEIKSSEWERVIIIDRRNSDSIMVSKIEFRRPKVIGNRLKR